MAATSGPLVVIVGGGFAGLFAARALDEMGTILWTAGIEAPPLAAAVARATGPSRTGPAAWSAVRISASPAIRRSW